MASFVYQTMSEKNIPFEEVDSRCPTMQEPPIGDIDTRQLTILLERSSIQRVVYSPVYTPYHGVKLCAVYSTWPKLLKNVVMMDIDDFNFFVSQVRIMNEAKKPVMVNWQKEGF